MKNSICNNFNRGKCQYPEDYLYINQFNLQKFFNLVESFSIENITYILDFRIILNYSNKPRIPKFLPTTTKTRGSRNPILNKAKKKRKKKKGGGNTTHSRDKDLQYQGR